MEQHKQATRECIKSMTQTYNLMEKDLRKQITEQEVKVSEQESMKLKLKQEIQQLQNAKEQMIEEKDSEIRKLKE